MFLFTELYYSTQKDLNQGELKRILAVGQVWTCLFICFGGFIFVLFFTVDKKHLLQLLAAA